ncbi:RagB/SusD family nutrient uptake outer membrane protein [Pedobacter jamesrossensis]|uniref:RagB/SusD family nutrient uptake outer membrane protein n=1 Tax=Pedobacter jamesrossensis TaxID=1908238 RepID=A0ABV8NLH6_9SPHI
MRKLTFLLLIFPVLASFISCKKSFLDEKSDSAYSPLNTFKNVAGLESGIAGLQASVREQYTMQVTQSLLAIFQVGTDVALNGLDAGEAEPFQNYALLNSESPAALNYWSWSYKVINNANQIIKGASDNTSVLTTAQRNLYLAEAKFYRAYAYNFLVTLWGTVPLIDQPLDVPKTDFVRASLENLNSLINDDLIFASANLPAIDGVSKPGRISKEAAQQLLAEAYLRQGKNDLAEVQCLNVINSKKFSIINARYGVKKALAGDPFSDMFTDGNLRRRQGNTEAIWVQEMEYNLPGGSSSLDQHRRVWVPYYSNVAGLLVCDSLGGRGIGRIRLSPWVINGLYKGNDMRNSKYNIHRDYYYNDPKNAKFGQKVVPLAADTLYKIVPSTTKWNHYLDADPTGNGSYKDLVMMRLGETYLLLAEAQFKQSKLGEAATSINVLRTRANAAQVTASDITLDFILDERVRELIGEENRRMTLARTGTLVDRLKKLNFKDNSTVQSYNQLLPIPQSEIDLNKDAKLAQNPGYIR